MHQGRSLNNLSSSTLHDAGLSPGALIIVLNHQKTPNPLHLRLTGEDSAQHKPKEANNGLAKWNSQPSGNLEDAVKKQNAMIEEDLDVTPEVIMKVTGARQPIKVPQRRATVFEEDEGEDGEPLDFMNLMRRLLMRG